ncbi:MAG: HD domain-containing phosphohydrolase [Solirubrobacterales bacterium]
MRPVPAYRANGGDPAVSLATLKDVALAAGRARTADGFLSEVVEQLAELVGAEHCSILMLEGRELRHAAAVGLPESYLSAIDGVEIGPEVGTCGTAAHTGETAITADVETDSNWDGYRELAREAGLRACWSVPLKLPDGSVLGTFANYSTEVFEPTREQVELTEAYASIVALGLDNVHRQAELARSYESAVLALTSALDVRDDYTGGHSTATSRLVRQVALRLGLDERRLERVARVAALHDVGKLGVPTEILTSHQPLTGDQRQLMRDHPVIGEQILRHIPGMEEVATAVRHEHERWDGAGYPDGLAGEQIPLESRIVFACDAYHAMISDRPYRAALAPAAAIEELRANAGTQFDPGAVASLIEVLGGQTEAGGCSPSEVEDRQRRETLQAVADDIGAEDVFVFRKVAPDTYSHLGGLGRGEGWAGNIELHRGDPRLLPGPAPGEVRCFCEDEPVRIVGPYYARSAVIAPCRHDVIVVFGSSTDSLRDAGGRDTAALADRVAQMVDHVPPAKRLADELEVLDAVRSVTTVGTTGVESTLAEIADRGANALACEFGAVIVDGDGPPRLGWSNRGWAPAEDPARVRELLLGLAAKARAAQDGAVLIQDTSEYPGAVVPGFGASDGAASLHAVAITGLAVLVTVHAHSRPRGFTGLCRRVARALADGSEVVIRRALAQEQLTRENATLELRASTDPLTGVNNRGAWDDAIADAQVELAGGTTTVAVALFDIDGLKSINDRLGHQAGDHLLRSFATILANQARSTDFVARIGGDEFAVLLRDCDEVGAASWCRRVIDAIDAHNELDSQQPIDVSWGCAAAGTFGSISGAFEAADRGLYGVKAAS